jgi:hypothetical protein
VTGVLSSIPSYPSCAVHLACSSQSGTGELDKGLHPCGLKQENLEFFDLDEDFRTQDSFQDRVQKDCRYEGEVSHGSQESGLGIDERGDILDYCLSECERGERLALIFA